MSERPQLIAFYLPQFHPIPENDEWWGRGFTEWRNVVRARPRHSGQYQPHIPGELGFYDLRMPEIRQQQAALARSHGIAGFCYYHYWFNGHRVLERPFNEVLASGQPDFPFCLCWANEPWTRNWDGGVRDYLIPQRYSVDDDRAHIAWLVGAFKDERYIRVDGRPVMMVYCAASLPDQLRTTTIWRQESIAAGTGDPYLIKFDTFGDDSDPQAGGFDAAAEFLPHGVQELATASGFSRVGGVDATDDVWRYDDIVTTMLDRPLPRWKRYPCVFPGWDNTPRRAGIPATIFLNESPEAYERWLDGTYRRARRAGYEFVFINAWNEWAESAHLEPDLRHGRAYLEATARVAGVDVNRADPEPTNGDAGQVRTEPGIEDTEAAMLDYRSLYFQHRATMAREIEGLLGHIQQLEDKLAEAERLAADPSPTNGTAPRMSDEASVLKRLVRTAGIIRRDWRHL